MNILITGSSGFIGKNLACSLMNIKEGKDRAHSDIVIDEIFLYDTHKSEDELSFYCEKADFVFNLAGINRPENESEYKGNCDFAKKLLSLLEKHSNKCPVMLSSSIQATLEGRYSGSAYGKSKKDGEDVFFAYGERVGAKVLVYRFPNVFGKWCRPNYNSAVATFCHNIANDLPITVTDESTVLNLVYIDDLVNEMLCALKSKEHRCDFLALEINENTNGKYCFVPVQHSVTLGKIVELLYSFNSLSETLVVPSIPDDSFEKKLYSTFLSYLPEGKVAYSLKTNSDERGSFTELIKSTCCGQVSINITKPSVKKGEHWHHTKWEIFIVVAGEGVIRQRKIGSDEILSFYVSGKDIKAVRILPGYTHNIENLSQSEDLVTVMWANEHFDKDKPDTFFEVVEK